MTPRLPLYLCVLLSALACVAQTPSATTPTLPLVYPSQGALADKIAAIVQVPAVSRAHWGVAVTAMDGTPLYGFNEGQFFRPASNAKLFTTAAAMALLHPDATFKTQIFGKLDAKTGTVEGDLVLVGGGDPSFGSNDLPYVAPALRPKPPLPSTPALADLREMVDQLVARGVKHVTGRVVGDDTLFPYEPFPGSWDAGDAVWGYGAPISALTIADNELRLTISPGAITGSTNRETYTNCRATVDDNGVRYYKVESKVQVTLAGTGSHADVERLPGSRVLRAYGQMATDAPSDIEEIAIDDPALYAAMALRSLLAERGITVDGTASEERDPNIVRTVAADGMAAAQHKPVASIETPGKGAPSSEDLVMAGGMNGGNCMTAWQPGPMLAVHVSSPLGADVLFTNKVSQNLHAELMLHHLGKVIFCGSGSNAGGRRMVRAFLKHAGLDDSDFVFYDGSGLSSHDLVTPRATDKLLSYASTQPWFAQWKASLPTGGEDGTLRARFGEKSGLKDHVFAKTGTLGESRALSGYLDAASGKTIIFSVFVDTHTPVGSADREAMDAIVAAIAATN